MDDPFVDVPEEIVFDEEGNLLIAPLQSEMQSRVDAVEAEERAFKAQAKETAARQPDKSMGAPTVTPASAARSAGSSASASASAGGSNSATRKRRSPEKGLPSGSPATRRRMDQASPAGVTLQERHMRLRLPTSQGQEARYRPISDLQEGQHASLMAWWAKYKGRVSEFANFEKFSRSETRCCGAKVISKSNSDWGVDSNFACAICTTGQIKSNRSGGKINPMRPCIRLVSLPNEVDGLDRVLEIMPIAQVPGSNPQGAFDYWGAPVA